MENSVRSGLLKTVWFNDLKCGQLLPGRFFVITGNPLQEFFGDRKRNRFFIFLTSFGTRRRFLMWQNEKTDHAVFALNVIFHIPALDVTFKLIGCIGAFPEQKGKMSPIEEIARREHPELVRKNFQMFHIFLNGKIAEDKRRKNVFVPSVLMGTASEKKGKFVILTADHDGNAVLFIGQKESDQFYINLRQKYVKRDEDRRQGKGQCNIQQYPISSFSEYFSKFRHTERILIPTLHFF